MRSLNKAFTGPVFWGATDPDARLRETGYHLVVYATLYQGAARHLEAALCQEWQERVALFQGQGAGPDAPTGGSHPRAVRLEYRQGYTPPPGAVVLTQAMIRTALGLSDFHRDPEYTVPPFPAFAVPLAEGGVEWVLLPDAVRDARGRYQNPAGFAIHRVPTLSTHTGPEYQTPRAMACLSVSPAPGDQPPSCRHLLEQVFAENEREGLRSPSEAMEGVTLEVGDDCGP